MPIISYFFKICIIKFPPKRGGKASLYSRSCEIASSTFVFSTSSKGLNYLLNFFPFIFGIIKLATIYSVCSVHED